MGIQRKVGGDIHIGGHIGIGARVGCRVIAPIYKVIPGIGYCRDRCSAASIIDRLRRNTPLNTASCSGAIGQSERFYMRSVPLLPVFYSL